VGKTTPTQREWRYRHHRARRGDYLGTPSFSGTLPGGYQLIETDQTAVTLDRPTSS